MWINSCYQVDVSVLCTAGDVMLMIILVLRVISGSSHPLSLTWHFLHPGLNHVILLFASKPKYFSSIHDSVSIGLVMASTGYLENIYAEVMAPPKNGMLDVVELVCDVIKHSRNPDVIDSRNGGELFECPMCLVPMYPPIHQVCLLAELITFNYSISVVSY